MAKLFRAVFVLLLVLALPFFIYSKAFSTHQEISYWINGYDIGKDPYKWADPNLNFKIDASGNRGLRIDGTVRTAVVSFVGLEHGDNNEYFVCGQSDQGNCRSSKKATQKRFRPNNEGQIHIEVCGGGDDWIKGRKINSTTDNTKAEPADWIEVQKGCDENKDYFHEGKVYRLWLYQDKEAENSITVAEFFVKHSYPVIKIDSSPQGGIFNALRPISINLWGRRPGGDNKNNYQVVLEGTNNNTKIEKCPTAPEGGITEPGKDPPSYTVGIHTQGIDPTTGKVKPDQLFNGTGEGGVAGSGKGAEEELERKGGAGLGQGSFVLKINERVSDSRPLGIGNNCEGGHSYIYIYFRFDPKAPRGLDIFKVVYDPNNADWEDISEELLDLQFKAPPPPCAPGALQDEKCTAINSAIGTINTTPQGFITSIFSFVLAIAGFGAMILIIYSGYLFMTSQGDKERIAGARETITSAIVGLLFIILSFIVLEIIGFDILRIPGLTR